MNAPTVSPVLQMQELDVRYTVRGRERQVLRGLSFQIEHGESFGLVGESGCGKSTAAMAIVRYLARNARVHSGGIHLNGTDILGMNGEQLRKMRTRGVSMVYQEPGRALNPSMRIVDQLMEVYSLLGRNADEARDESLAMLGRMQISGPERVLQSFPHTLSGGMQQRVVIAMALATNPSLLILDEPTTALDSTVGAEVLEIVARLRAELGTSVLLISHNLASVAQMCERVGVLYAGRLVESGTAQELFENPVHPYTASLLKCIPGSGNNKRISRLATIAGTLPDPDQPVSGCPYSPRCPLVTTVCTTNDPPAFDLGDRYSRCFHYDQVKQMNPGEGIVATEPSVIDYSAEPILSLEHASKTYGRGEQAFRVVNNVSISLWPGETLGIVGESGSGKTTLGRLAMGLTNSDPGGSMVMAGRPLLDVGRKRDAQQIKEMQIVFQNPDNALNRRHSIRHIVGRSIAKLAGLRGGALQQRIRELAADFQISDRYLGVRPKQLSGGLKQRVAIARAFAGEPRVVICDEPTSALDVSVQASILNMLADLQFRQNVAYLFISHDLGVIQYMADRIAVMYLGHVMEVGPTAQIIEELHHPYTEVLLSAVPTLSGIQPDRIRLRGDPPDARRPPAGCPFQTRCPQKIGKICEEEAPGLRQLDDDHYIACHLPDEELPHFGVDVREQIVDTGPSQHESRMPHASEKVENL
jgi:peptide/nickel transport system ATP-binding protein